jgi:anti-anti-sigma factor
VKTLEAKVRNQPGLTVIDLQGDIDAAAEATLNQAYAQAEQGNSNPILLNFDQVEYINSTGIALIVGLLAKARQAHRRLMTCGLSDHYLEIFQITRLADFMNIYNDEASAIADADSKTV